MAQRHELELAVAVSGTVELAVAVSGTGDMCMDNDGERRNTSMRWVNLAPCYSHLCELAGALTCATRCYPLRTCVDLCGRCAWCAVRRVRDGQPLLEWLGLCRRALAL